MTVLEQLQADREKQIARLRKHLATGVISQAEYDSLVAKLSKPTE